MGFTLATKSPWLILFVLFAYNYFPHLALSANILKGYSDWSEYFTNPNAVKTNHYLKKPIDVWPDGVMKNYAKHKVS